MTVTIPERFRPVQPEGWTPRRRGNPEHWSLSHDEALALIAVADQRGVRVGPVQVNSVRVSDGDPRVWQKDGWSPNRWSWGFTLLFPGPRDVGWLPWPVHSAYTLFSWIDRMAGVPGHRDAPARDAARSWHRQREEGA
jgi:hypothetical protein